MNVTKKCSPDMNVPSVPMITNGVHYYRFDWVNYARDLDSMLSFYGPNYRNK